ncbi:unnamed protein product, partial [Rotaria sordida]
VTIPKHEKNDHLKFDHPIVSDNDQGDWM